MNVKRQFDEANSDHAAPCVDFYFLNSPLLKKKKDPQENSKPATKLNNTILRGKELSNFQKKVNEFFDELSFDSTINLSPSELLDELETHIVKEANEKAKVKVRKRPDWFSEVEQELTDLIKERNQAFKAFVKQPSEENHRKLKDTRRWLQKEKRKAKRQWQFAYAKECKKTDFTVNPKEAWSMIFKLMEGKNTTKLTCPKTVDQKMV
jgi:hypothetical protein